MLPTYDQSLSLLHKANHVSTTFVKEDLSLPLVNHHLYHDYIIVVYSWAMFISILFHFKTVYICISPTP